MAFQPTRTAPGWAHRGDGGFAVHRTLPEEAPVALVFDGATLAVMMASPADLRDFAYGFAIGEGIVTGPDEIEGFELAERELGIEARIWLRDDRRAALAERRRFMAGPVGCGLCGVSSLEAAARPLPKLTGDGLVLAASDVACATEALRAFQPLHDKTRASHAAGLIAPGRGVILAREDVGRHNALDKLIGAAARAGVAPGGAAVAITSRLSVELVQKCAMAGWPVLIAVSAPTAHAVRLAEEAGITLAAFARDGGFDLYAHPYRILTGVTHVA